MEQIIQILPFHVDIIHLIKFFVFKHENFQFMMILANSLLSKILPGLSGMDPVA